MAVNTVLEVNDLLTLAASLTPLQRQLLLSLRERGPGLLLELAMRVLKFPEEISSPVADLRDKRLVQTSDFSGGALGSELISLTPQGERLTSLLRDESFRQQLERLTVRGAESATSRGANPQIEEAALLRKLGELAEQRGDLTEATTYYQQALDATRKLTTPVVAQ